MALHVARARGEAVASGQLSKESTGGEGSPRTPSDACWLVVNARYFN